MLNKTLILLGLILSISAIDETKTDNGNLKTDNTKKVTDQNISKSSEDIKINAKLTAEERNALTQEVTVSVTDDKLKKILAEISINQLKDVTYVFPNMNADNKITGTAFITEMLNPDSAQYNYLSAKKFKIELTFYIVLKDGEKVLLLKLIYYAYKFVKYNLENEVFFVNETCNPEKKIIEDKNIESECQLSTTIVENIHKAIKAIVTAETNNDNAVTVANAIAECVKSKIVEKFTESHLKCLVNGLSDAEVAKVIEAVKNNQKVKDANLVDALKKMTEGGNNLLVSNSAITPKQTENTEEKKQTTLI